MDDKPVGPVDVLMVAVGGYGYYYLRTLLDEVPASRARLAGVVDPEARRSRAWPDINGLGVPVHAAIEEFYAAGHHADLAVIVSPIQHHVPQSSVALANGSHVLCDKPLGATVQEAAELVGARDRTGRQVRIGYQWAFSDAILTLKRDILSGAFGRPLRFSALCCWPRDLAYYRRNHWAGRLRDPESGRWVLDSPANNAMAHSLFNLLFLAGGEMEASATPLSVQAELCRAYEIESCDTAACRVVTAELPELLFFASHVTEAPIDPCFRLEFERALVSFGDGARQIVATDASGHRKEYGAPDETTQFRKLHLAVDAVTRSAPIVCGPEAAGRQTLVVNGMHESAGIVPFPLSLVERDEAAGRLWVRDLGDALRRCFDRGELPHEIGAEWAVEGRTMDVTGYRSFPAGDSR